MHHLVIVARVSAQNRISLCTKSKFFSVIDFSTLKKELNNPAGHERILLSKQPGSRTAGHLNLAELCHAWALNPFCCLINHWYFQSALRIVFLLSIVIIHHSIVPTCGSSQRCDLLSPSCVVIIVSVPSVPGPQLSSPTPSWWTALYFYLYHVRKGIKQPMKTEALL